MIIAVDFDGTIVEHKYPEIGEELPFATETLRMLIKDKHQLILWSVREGKLLEDAVNWCRERGVEFYAVNKDYPEEKQEWKPLNMTWTIGMLFCSMPRCSMKVRITLHGGVTGPVHVKGMPAGDWTIFT